MHFTGVLDDATYDKMSNPRCGMRDVESDGPIIARRKRYAVWSTIWNKNSLTWGIYDRTSDSSVAGNLDTILGDALAVRVAWHCS